MSSVLLILALLVAPPLPDEDDPSLLRPTDLLKNLDHPDRWRWIPNQKMPRGKFLKRAGVTSFFSPFIFFEGDVGTGGGFAITDIDFRTKRRSQLAHIWATFTSEGQERFSIAWQNWLAQSDHPDRGVLQGDRDFFGITIAHTRTLTSRFFGLGAETELADEASYSRETNSIGFGIQRSFPELGGDWVWHTNLFLQTDDLAGGKVSGAFDVQTRHTVLFNEGDDFDALWISAGIRHDTRDAQHLPYRGRSLGISITAIPVANHREAGAVASVSGSWIHPVSPLFHDGGNPAHEHPPIDSISAFFAVSTTMGDVPFWALPSLGGANIMRGTIRGRWRDRNAWATGAEWRPWVIADGFPISDKIRVERVGLALFAEAGSVAAQLGDLADASIHSSIGVGLRFTFERQALFRMDIGRSEEGDSNLSLAYGLPF
ncbi:MAG: hypothetical protein HRU16_06270 [Planctomycetes bacterium]|nr:hypothetical protein [Planctomycetota bacterium]